MNIHQVLATLGYGDAIGHEAMGIQRALRASGIQSEIFVETADPRLEPLTIDYRELPGASHPDNILIHHFSICSKASRIAFALPDRMVLIYHNITPPEYFIGVHPLLVQLCYMGRRELRAYVPRVDLALGDSEFNRQELAGLGFDPTGVLPVVPDFSHLEGPAHPFVAGAFDDEWTNILFVGRIIPNKRIEDLIRFFHAYRTRHNPRSRLIIVGAYGGFEGYLAMLHELGAALGAKDVHFVGQVSDEELAAYYSVADVFLCASEHEGFCVPLVEAFAMRVPVVAYAATAVPATMDGAGVLFNDRTPARVALVIDAIVTDAALQERVLRGQDAALERLRARDFGRTLLGFLEQVQRTPRRAPHEVTWDFWTQLELAERLEELRMYRPSAYKALPKATPAAAPEFGNRDSGCGADATQRTPIAATTVDRTPRILNPESGIP